MEIRDEDIGLAQVDQQVRWRHVELAIVVVRIVRQQHPQAITNRDAGCDDQKSIGETRILGIRELVQYLPGNEHRHDDRLTASGRHLQGDAIQLRIRLSVGSARFVLDPGVAVLSGAFGEVDRRFEGFNLAEE